jgi:iron complex outermembrane receptor protein/hemoglobin/transferrin/lactoferrin receptor protein
VLAGVGFRTVGLLEGGGTLQNPADGQPVGVPRLAEDGRTQLGTGFDELTFDTRLVVRILQNLRAVGAVYGYRQFDAPRTDQCPPATAPHDECLTFEEEFRTLAYVAVEGDLGPAARSFRASISYQRQHERRRLDRPASFVRLTGRDNVDTYGLVARAQTGRWRPLWWLDLAMGYGIDLYHDSVGSAAWSAFTDIDRTIGLSRGLYLDGSRYLSFGAYAEGEARFPHDIALRAGGRLAIAAANAPGDVASGSEPVDRVWVAPVGRAGISYWPLDWLEILVNLDQGYRAPNLDDLTSRQQTGPGFQFENASLGPERSLTLEGGLRVEWDFVRAQAFGFWTRIDGSIVRAPRAPAECPPSTDQCAASWYRYQLVNADAASNIFGVELLALFRIPWGFRLRASLAYAFGEGPSPGDPPSDPTIPWQERVPLSRIPPLNGTAELRWYNGRTGLFAGAGLRWALAQDRLAISDQSDSRIPKGGTPGFAVLDLRLGWRWGRRALVALVVENVTDAVYRYHGSSVNGPGRGIALNVELGL